MASQKLANVGNMVAIQSWGYSADGKPKVSKTQSRYVFNYRGTHPDQKITIWKQFKKPNILAPESDWCLIQESHICFKLN